VSIGRVERELRRKLNSGEKLFFLLSDPERPLEPGLVKEFDDSGADALLVGGSVNVAPTDIDRYITSLRRLDISIPIVLFPGGLNNIAGSADAILFMVLMNSLDPYWLMGAQVTAAPLIKRFGLEAIPTGYVIVGHGGAAGHIGRAHPIPFENPYLASIYAMAAEMLGFRFLYLEAGSGSPRPVPLEAIRAARNSTDYIVLVVGGGIRSSDYALKLYDVGADAIVIGTLAERDPQAALQMLVNIKRR